MENLIFFVNYDGIENRKALALLVRVANELVSMLQGFPVNELGSWRLAQADLRQWPVTAS